MPVDPALAELYESKAKDYAAFGNGVVAARALELLPPGGSVLDLGCASGGLLALLRPHAGHLAGLELSPTAAAAAAQIGDEVVQGAFEDADLPFAADSYDLVVIADVLEHLPDPAGALRRAVGWCRPGGAVLISVPNIGHLRARVELLRGRWPQEQSGTFDSSHLRFFTLDVLAALLRDAGLTAVELRPVVPALRNHLPLDRVPGRLREGAERGWQALGRARPGLLGYQLVGSGRRPR